MEIKIIVRGGMVVAVYGTETASLELYDFDGEESDETYAEWDKDIEDFNKDLHLIF